MHWNRAREHPVKATTQGIVVSRGDTTTQLPRAAGSKSSIEILCKGQNTNFCASKDRQHYSGGLHKQPGRHSVQRADSPYQEHMVVVPGEEHTLSGATTTWSNEHQEGSGIQIPGRLVCWKLDYQISLLYTDHWKRTCLHRDWPISAPTISSGGQICMQRLWMHPSGLVIDKGICQSSMEPDH